MAVEIRDLALVAHLPLVLGVLRKLNVASLVDTIIPPHPEHVLSCGRGVETLVLAILDGHHALYEVGTRLDERGMLPLLSQPGLTRASPRCMTRARGRFSMPCSRPISTGCLTMMTKRATSI